MAWTSGVTKANGDLFLYTEFNSYLGPTGNLFETAPAKSTAAGQVFYSTGVNAIAALAAGTSGQFLRSGGAGAPAWANTRRCVAHPSIAQTITTGIVTKLVLATVSENTDSWFDDANDRITVTVPGYFLVRAHVRWTANATGERSILIRKNGADVAWFHTPGVSTASYLTSYVERSMSLAASDYIEAFLYQDSGGNLATYTAGAPTVHNALEVIQMPGAA